ncbi:choline dehydrogenase [Diaporthe eres]|nr:choline dehydrogenase [Diaporthe eres]
MWPFSSSYPEVSPSMVDGKTYDYIIVGGGTAGCALASRLSEDPEVSVLVLEKGAVKNSLLSRSPLLSQNFHFGDKLQVVSDRFSEPSPEANGDKFQLWTAEGLGGASRINGMVMTRGPPADYNAWAQDMSLDDWAWERVEPFFRKSENNIGRPGSQARGHDGPIKTRQFRTTFAWGPYIEKAAQAVSFYHRRCQRPRRYAGSVRGVFVRPTAISKSTSDVYVEARREVIVCCGALKTAQLIMLSGIGPRDPLDANGIHFLQDLPFGRFLSDHFAFPIALELPRRETMHMFETEIYGLWHALLWFLFRTGIMSSNCIPNTIFVRSGAIDDKTIAIVAQDAESDGDGHSGNNMDISQQRNTPDIEVMMFAVSGFKRKTPGRSLFTFYPCLVQPHSQGQVELADSDLLSHPKVTHPMLRSQQDWPVARKAIRFSMRLAQEFQRSGYPHQAPIAFAPGNELDKLAEWEATAETEQSAAATTVKASRESAALASSTPAKTWDTVTDDEIDRYIRSVAGVSLHPSCTCRVSNDPRSGVVDQRLRVYGVRNLRIADTSVFPRMLSTHTMWPAIMVGERCADFIKKDWSK